MIATIPMLAGNDNPAIERFLEHCHRRQYPAKSVIIYAGDEPNVLYYIIKGSVTVLIEDEDGREIVLAYLNPGDFFGEMGLFMPEQKRSAWIRARVECELGEISYSKFRQLSTENPDIMFELAKRNVILFDDVIDPALLEPTDLLPGASAVAVNHPVTG